MTPILTVFEDNKKLIFDVFDQEYIEEITNNEDMVEKVIDVHRVEAKNIDGELAAVSFGCKKPGLQFKGKYHIMLTDDDVSRSLAYLYKKGTKEVKNFYKPDFIKKIAVEKGEVLFAKSRILDCQRFEAAGGLENSGILAEMRIDFMTPVLDRFSPLSYSIADYVHRKVANHSGYENCMRESINHCFIIQGLSLYREIGDDCVGCVKNRKKYMEIAMGPVADEQLVIAPAFWIAMCDIYGPVKVYVPGHSMRTRNKEAIDVKVYILVFVCPTTKLTNLQVIETKGADGIAEGLTRLGCEIGIPTYMLADQDSGILKVLKEADIQVADLQVFLYKEKGVKFRTCPVAGHNYHGIVERKIRTVQECLDKCDLNTQRLHATGLQTLAKLIENNLNNLPLGFGYAREGVNSPLLKLIFPNMLRIGRVNSRALQGPVRLPKSPGELCKKIEEKYKLFFELWNTTMVPRLMKSNKWFNTKSQLQVGDLVWFRKVESELSSEWTLGRISSVVKSKDDIVRRVEVQYQNANEDQPRFTDRAARSLIKLFHVDDENWQADMAEVEKLVEAIEKEEVKDSIYTMNPVEGGLKFKFAREEEAPLGEKLESWVAKRKLRKGCTKCCCVSHCLLTSHERDAVTIQVPSYNTSQQIEFPSMLDRSWMELDEFEEEMLEHQEEDKFMSLLCSVNTDFSGGVEL